MIARESTVNTPVLAAGLSARAIDPARALGGVRGVNAARPAHTARPVDRLLAVYNLLLAGLWTSVTVAAEPAATGSGLAFELGPGKASLLAMAHLIAAGIPLLVGRLPRSPGFGSRLLRLLHEVYPLLLLPVFWLELDPLIRTLHGTTRDAAIMGLDRAVFGFHLDQVWIRAMPQTWFSELMHFSYWIYLPLIFTPPIVMVLRRDAVGLQDVTLRLLATYVGCYVVYLAFPTAGPKVFGVLFEGARDGIFLGLVARAHETGNVYGAAFPSSHVAGAVTVAWLGWRWFPPAAAVLLTLQAAGVLMSTVYTQNHYAVDSLAGLGFALAVQAWVVPTLRGRQ